MKELSHNYFVCVAEIAAKLDQATHIAQHLSLTASNARAVALRAGEKAAGFRPLTDFIDRLADITIKSSRSINQLASTLSQTSAEKVRADSAIKHFNIVYEKAKDSQFIGSLDQVYQRCQTKQYELDKSYKKQIDNLSEELALLSNELRNAVIVSTLSRVEASQAGIQYQDALINVAANVEGAAGKIKEHIQYSQQMVIILEEY